ARSVESGLSLSRIMDENPSVSADTIYSIKRHYCDHWRQRVKSAGATLSSIPDLVKRCFAEFRQQFMQIRRGPNQLFVTTT
ncbi:MAG: hypothetical protein LUC41_03275, partial [Clostridiales bacterium]|nr:hypothetical protein [Clostridiales bacterium]